MSVLSICLLDMGLGKTLQAICIMVSDHFYRNAAWGTSYLLFVVVDDMLVSGKVCMGVIVSLTRFSFVWKLCLIRY